MSSSSLPVPKTGTRTLSSSTSGWCLSSACSGTETRLVSGSPSTTRAVDEVGDEPEDHPAAADPAAPRRGRTIDSETKPAPGQQQPDQGGHRNRRAAEPDPERNRVRALAIGIGEAQPDQRQVRDRDRQRRAEREDAGEQLDVARAGRGRSRSRRRSGSRCAGSSGCRRACRASSGSAGWSRARRRAARARASSRWPRRAGPAGRSRTTAHWKTSESQPGSKAAMTPSTGLLEGGRERGLPARSGRRPPAAPSARRSDIPT